MRSLVFSIFTNVLKEIFEYNYFNVNLCKKINKLIGKLLRSGECE